MFYSKGKIKLHELHLYAIEADMLCVKYHFLGRSRYVTKLGGNKDDPYNLSKGTWNRRYMVLQDDLR
jgi:hypothetical protein